MVLNLTLKFIISRRDLSSTYIQIRCNGCLCQPSTGCNAAGVAEHSMQNVRLLAAPQPGPSQPGRPRHPDCYSCLYYYVHVLNHLNMYIQCTTLYIVYCVAHVQCTDGYIYFMKFTDTAETCTYIDVSFWMQLFDLPCWLACRLGLAAAWCHA